MRSASDSINPSHPIDPSAPLPAISPFRPIDPSAPRPAIPPTSTAAAADPTPPSNPSAPPPTSPPSPPPRRPPPLDLETYSEATRRALYDLVVAVHFTPPPDRTAGDDSPDWYPDYTPDQADLAIHFWNARWLASWTRLEELASDLPADRRRALVRIQAAPEARHGVAFYEV
jgi:hypothetical protein